MGGAPIKILGRANIMCILKLDHITGPIYLILCFPYVVVFILGIGKLPEFLRL